MLEYPEVTIDPNKNNFVKSRLIKENEILVLIAPPGLNQSEMEVLLKQTKEIHFGNILILSHGWQISSLEEVKETINHLDEENSPI